VISAYVPNGKEVGHEKYTYKLAWLERLYAYLDRIEYVVKDGEEGLPDDLKHLEGTVTPVSYEYEDDEAGARRPNDTHNR